MGALIQTKGTQRLAKLFNDRFDAGSMPSTRGVAGTFSGSPINLRDSFRNVSLDLLAISDLFIAQNAVAASWTPDGNDFLYPSATLRATNATGSTNTLSFALPSGFANIPAGSYVTVGSAVSSLDARKTIPKGTVAGAPTAPVGGVFNVPLLDKNGAPVNVSITNQERICFNKGKHEQLVRRWRWYLRNDLLPENHAAMRRAISNALDDPAFRRITFQTIEDKQRVVAIAETQLDGNLEFDDVYHMRIILMTQQTTAPDPLDPQ